MPPGASLAANAGQFSVGPVKESGKQPQPTTPDIQGAFATGKTRTRGDACDQPDCSQVIGSDGRVDHWKDAHAVDFVGPGITDHVLDFRAEELMKQSWDIWERN